MKLAVPALLCLMWSTAVPAFALFAPAGSEETAAQSNDDSRPTTIARTIGDIDLKQSLSTEIVQVADVFAFDVEVRAPEGTVVAFPEFGERVGKLELINRAVVPDIPVEGGRSWTLRLELESLVSGQLVVPEFQIDVRRQNGVEPTKVESIQTTSMSLQVSSFLSEDDDAQHFRDIRSVVDMEVPEETSNRTLVWGSFGLGVLTLAGLAIAWTRRNGGPTPSAWALGELKKLASAQALTQTECKTLFTRQADVLRNYVRARFPALADRGTTLEISQGLLDIPGLNREVQIEVTQLLSAADEVKFAGVSVATEQLQRFNQQSCEAIQRMERSVKEEARKR